MASSARLCIEFKSGFRVRRFSYYLLRNATYERHVYELRIGGA